MGAGELPVRTGRCKLLARFAGPSVWIFAGLAPILFLARLFVLTLYSIPESDDFCLSYLNAERGFAETIWIWYHSAVGRVVPLVLIQIPAAVSGAAGIDYFTSYAATLTAFEICFAAAILFLAFRLWPRASLPQIVFIGSAFAATMLSGVPSLREMLYWLPGVTCYTLPGLIVVLVLVELVQTAESGTRFSPVATCIVALGCLIASLCNEFTAAWLIGFVLCSLIVRAIFRHDNFQVGEHAIIGAAALIGFAILLLAPGNAVRIGMFPMAGDISRSVSEAWLYSVTQLNLVVTEPPTLAWLVIVMIFTAVLPQPDKIAAWKRLLLAVLVFMLCFACSYLAYFTAEYATGANLPTRSQNETMILVISGLTISAALVARSFRGSISRVFPAIPGRWDSFAMTIVAVGLGAILILPLDKNRTMNLLRSEQKSFHVFWLESMERHARLTLSSEENLVVANRSVFPTALMEEEMTDNPYRLPNDCIARFYGKKAVIVKPQVQTATSADILAVLPKLISGIRAANGALEAGLVTPPMLMSSNIEVPSLFLRGDSFFSPWGRLVMTRSTDNTVFDFYSLPHDICRELLLGAGRIEGVLQIADSGKAADEKRAPINPEQSEGLCPGSQSMARVIFANSAATSPP